MTDYQNALVLDNLNLVSWVIRTRISIPNRPLLTYDDFYAIGCEAICRAALKYNADTGEFAPFACRYIYNAIVDHCRAINFRMERNVEIPENEDPALLDLLAHTSVDFDESVTDTTAMAALAACLVRCGSSASLAALLCMLCELVVARLALGARAMVPLAPFLVAPLAVAASLGW